MTISVFKLIVDVTKSEKAIKAMPAPLEKVDSQKLLCLLNLDKEFHIKVTYCLNEIIMWSMDSQES